MRYLTIRIAVILLVLIVHVAVLLTQPRIVWPYEIPSLAAHVLLTAAVWGPGIVHAGTRAAYLRVQRIVRILLAVLLAFWGANEFIGARIFSPAMVPNDYMIALAAAGIGDVLAAAASVWLVVTDGRDAPP